MKSAILGSLIVFSSSSVFAQGGASTARPSTPEARTHSAKGIQVSLFSYKPSVKLEAGNYSDTDKEALQVSAGLSLGYVSAPLSGFGWESRLVFAEIRSKGQYSTSDDVGRIEGSFRVRSMATA